MHCKLNAICSLKYVSVASPSGRWFLALFVGIFKSVKNWSYKLLIYTTVIVE